MMLLADAEDDLLGAHRSRGKHGPVEDQVRASCHQQAILPAVRFALGAVGDDHRGSMRCGGDRAPLESDWKARAAAPGETCAYQQLNQGVAALRQRAEPGHVLRPSLAPSRGVRASEQLRRAHRGSRRSTASWNEDLASARGSREPVRNRYPIATTTAITQNAWRVSSHADPASVPVPTPWRTAKGQAAYGSQCTSRHAAWPMNPRTRLVRTIASSSSNAIVPRPS